MLLLCPEIEYSKTSYAKLGGGVDNSGEEGVAQADFGE